MTLDEIINLPIGTHSFKFTDHNACLRDLEQAFGSLNSSKKTMSYSINDATKIATITIWVR